MILKWVNSEISLFQRCSTHYNHCKLFYLLNLLNHFSHNERYSIGLVDYRRIRITAGSGGDGIVSYTAHASHKRIGPGLPNGGRGGRGSSIYAIGNRQARLSRLPGTITGHDGRRGKGSNCSGDNGDDVVVKVPLGTLIYKIIDCDNSDNRAFIASVNDEKILLCKGGKGGRGNDMLNPYDCEPGEIGESGIFDFELECIAEVGLFGYPNAGKSTLLSCISRANPRIACFPYTTTQPCIDGMSIKVADLPGATDGSISTLEHLERTKIIAYVIDNINDLQRLRNLIKEYNDQLLSKSFLIVFTKMDLQDDYKKIDKFISDESISSQIALTSARLNLGIPDLVNLIRKTVDSLL